MIKLQLYNIKYKLYEILEESRNENILTDVLSEICTELML